MPSSATAAAAAAAAAAAGKSAAAAAPPAVLPPTVFHADNQLNSPVQQALQQPSAGAGTGTGTASQPAAAQGHLRSQVLAVTVPAGQSGDNPAGTSCSAVQQQQQQQQQQQAAGANPNAQGGQSQRAAPTSGPQAGVVQADTDNDAAAAAAAAGLVAAALPSPGSGRHAGPAAAAEHAAVPSMLRLSDPRNLGRLLLPAEVLQQLYAHLAPEDWRQLQQQLLQQAAGHSTNHAEVHAKITVASTEEACAVWERLVDRGCASFLERVLPARASLTVVLACRQCAHAGGSQAAGELATLQLQGTAELA
ncbi:hypothetical protein OEZ86_000480 [Tetradesmus obliquus]|nr:hypothetical protein OEZ86_000480 [Tetradesmus obliquus]